MGESFQWIADALARQLARVAAVHDRRRKSHEYDWEGLTESDTVSLVQNLLDGLGFYTWLECSYPGATRRKMDVWGESPVFDQAITDWLIEVKNIWDGLDNRLNEKRVHENKEILGDFEKLSKVRGEEYRRFVIWVIYSKYTDLAEAREGSTTYRAANLISIVEQDFNASVIGKSSFDVTALTKDANRYGRHVHVLVFAVPEE